MKKMNVFLKIIYYIFTFAIGIILAAALPNIYMYDMTMDEIKTSLEDGDYANAMSFIGGYFNGEHVYQNDFGDGSSIVIFETATIVNKTDGSASTLQKSYSGFLFKAGNYQVEGEDNNLTKLLITTSDDDVVNVGLLDYDTDGNEVKDNISTILEKELLYFEVSNSLASTIKALEFLDKTGSTYVKVENLDLKYDTAFYTDVNDFLEEYNKDPNSEKLTELDEIFKSKNENYLMSSYGDVRSNAVKKSCFVVVIYFICIYILADFLVGKHYILKLIIKIIRKIKGVKPEEEIPKAELYAGDYYSQVTFKLIVDEDFSSSVRITYHNENDEIEFVLTKDENYTQTKRIHAGVYMNAWFECSGYEAFNLPKTLNVNGYKKTVEVTIRKEKTNN